MGRPCLCLGRWGLVGVLAHIMRDGDSILATSIGITHVRLLSLLKTMVVLQRDPETLAGHQQEYEQFYKYRTSPQRGTPP